MMEFVTSIVDKVVEHVKREGEYFFFVQNIMNDLKNEKENLTNERDSLKDRVEEAEDSGKIIEKRVEKWLNDVENILQEVAEMEPNMEANNNCFQGGCPTFKRYRLCKKMVKKIEEIVELRGDIMPFYHPGPLPAIQYKSSEKKFSVQNIMNELKNEKEKLTKERGSVQDSVEEAKDSGKIIEKPVEKWLIDVENILQELAEMELNMEANNNCFQGGCPTFKRYRLNKQMVKKTKEIVELREQSNIQPFSHRPPLPAIQYESSENFVDFESRRVAYHRLMEALQDDSCYMIGVYGMGGSGKTTLVTQVGKMAEQLNLFDKVICITVSQTLNIRYIQGKIADMISQSLLEESEVGRAHKLWSCLQGYKRFLVILDDLWGKFELADIGIFLNNDTKGIWKVLVTTRSKQICNSMGCQRRIYLDLLDDVESWTLFRKHANIDDDMSSETQENVCKECKGLPIAITAVGSSLKGKFNAKKVEGLRDVYSCLKLSCDYLKDKEAELLFSLCCMFPEYYEIPVEDLIRYAIGLGVGGSHPLEWVRSCIQAGINKLLDSSLLSQNHWLKDCVKIHDMVRDVGLKNHKILFNHDKPLGSKVMDRRMVYFAISSWYDENKISLELDAPNLQILLLEMRVKERLDLSHVTFKERDNKLKVFAVVRQKHSYPSYFRPQLSLPRSVEQWTNLQTVRLNRWNVGDISFLTSLTQLEVLDLEGCQINELPIEMGRLERLKMLDLSHCRFQGKYNGAIGKCLQLEELYAYECFGEYLPKSTMDIVTHSKLQRFVIGKIWDRQQRFRAIELSEFDMSKLRASGSNLLQVAEVVRLSCSCIRGCKNVIPDLVSVVGGMNNLTSLHLRYEEEIECILDATSDFYGQVDASIPKLVELRLFELKSLKELCRGPPQRFFEKLQGLLIWKCRQLHIIFPVECNLQNLKILSIEECSIGEEVLFSMSVAQSLQQLEYLRIDYVDGLKHIIGSGRGYGSNTTNQLFLPFLFPNLKKLEVGHCYKVESLFPICCCVEGLVQLQELKIIAFRELKYVFGECDHMDHSSLQYHNQIMLPRLMNLTLYGLWNLIDMCPENYPTRWPAPKKLKVDHCPKFTGRARLEGESMTSEA